MAQNSWDIAHRVDQKSSHEKYLLGRPFEQIWFYPNVDTVLISNLL